MTRLLALLGLLLLPAAVYASVVSVQTHGNLKGVDVVFSDPLDSATAIALSHYSIHKGADTIPVTAATLLNDFEVRLSADLPAGAVYTLTVNNLQTASAPAVNPLSQNPVNLDPNTVTFLQVHGLIERGTFFGLAPYDSVGPVLAGNPDRATRNYPFDAYAEPGVREFVDQISVPISNPNIDNYGVLLKGYLVPPTNGFYFFYIYADNQATFLLSTDESPDHVQSMCSEILFNGTSVPLTYSLPVSLEAGKRYYFEAYFQDEDGGDTMQLYWQHPGERPATIVDGSLYSFANTPSIESIDGRYLSLFGYSLGDVRFNSEPQDKTIPLGAAVTFSAQIDGAPPYELQWLQNGQPMSGQTNLTLTLYNLGREENHAKFSLVARNRFSIATSREASLTVSGADPPALSFTRLENSIVLSWPEDSRGAYLDWTDSLAPPITWQPWPSSELEIEITVPLDPAPRFFRLRL